MLSSPPEPVIRGSVVIALSHDLFASDIEICKHISASLGSFVIPAYLSSRLSSLDGDDGDERESSLSD